MAFQNEILSADFVRKRVKFQTVHIDDTTGERTILGTKEIQSNAIIPPEAWVTVATGRVKTDVESYKDKHEEKVTKDTKILTEAESILTPKVAEPGPE